jgi:phage major head subunit gpT-like protein
MDKPDDENVFMRKKFRYGVDDRKNVGYGLWQLAYGSKQTLDATNYAAARAAMMAFTNDEGVPLGITPTHLVVPPTLESNGRTVVEAQFDATGKNVWYNTRSWWLCPGWLSRQPINRRWHIPPPELQGEGR